MNDAQKNAVREADAYLRCAGLPTYSEVAGKPLALRPAQQATPEPVRPDIIERLTYHQLERDDLSLGDCLGYLTSGWKKVHGRTERQMVMQILALLAGQPATPEPVGEPGTVHVLRNALILAANRLDRLSLEVGCGTQERYDAEDWVKEACQALTAAHAAQPAQPVPIRSDKAGERIFALWIPPDSSDWDGVLGSYCTFDEAVEAWKEREDQHICNITALNRGVIAKAGLLVWKFGVSRASSTCPICRLSEPHQHSGKEIHDHREERNWENSTRQKLWEDVMEKVKSITAHQPTKEQGK